jgi:hypothetical protein
MYSLSVTGRNVTRKTLSVGPAVPRTFLRTTIVTSVSRVLSRHFFENFNSVHFIRGIGVQLIFPESIWTWPLGKNHVYMCTRKKIYNYVDTVNNFLFYLYTYIYIYVYIYIIYLRNKAAEHGINMRVAHLIE